MDDLAAWLRAQLDEDERIARVVNADPVSDCWFDCTGDGHGDHHLRWGPERVMAEVDAKRRILRRGGPVCTCADQSQPMNPDTNWTTPLEHHLDCAAYETAKLLALPYADRPGYRPEWRP